MDLLELIPPAGKVKTGRLFLNAKGKAYMSFSPREQFSGLFTAFLENASGEISTTIVDKLHHGQRTAASQAVAVNIKNDLLDIFKTITASCGWLCVDEIFLKMWAVLHNYFPNKLLSPEQFNDYITNPKPWDKKEPTKSFLTRHVYYPLGVGFDKHFLFPLDRYFGLAECVWTDFENIAGDINHYFGFVLKLAGNYGYYTAQEKRDYALFCDILLSPCTCFRMLAKAV
jgi:hypothetical protein